MLFIIMVCLIVGATKNGMMWNGCQNWEASKLNQNRRWFMKTIPCNDSMDVWQGDMDYLKFNPRPPCPTLPCPAGGPPLKRPHSRFRGCPPTGRAACGRLLPFRTPHALRLWMTAEFMAWIQLMTDGQAERIMGTFSIRSSVMNITRYY
jgi:hypothetical protein